MASAAVLVGILGIGALRALGLELGVAFLEGVGDVLEEDQAEDDVLVLGGVHVVAQRVGGGPELRLEADGGAVVGVARGTAATWGGAGIARGNGRCQGARRITAVHGRGIGDALQIGARGRGEAQRAAAAATLLHHAGGDQCIARGRVRRIIDFVAEPLGQAPAQGLVAQAAAIARQQLQQCRDEGVVGSGHARESSEGMRARIVTRIARRATPCRAGASGAPAQPQKAMRKLRARRGPARQSVAAWALDKRPCVLLY